MESQVVSLHDFFQQTENSIRNKWKVKTLIL